MFSLYLKCHSLCMIGPECRQTEAGMFQIAKLLLVLLAVTDDSD